MNVNTPDHKSSISHLPQPALLLRRLAGRLRHGTAKNVNEHDILAILEAAELIRRLHARIAKMQRLVSIMPHTAERDRLVFALADIDDLRSW